MATPAPPPAILPHCLALAYSRAMNVITLQDLIPLIITAALPGVVIGGIIGARTWKTKPAAGVVTGAIIGAPLSLAIALGLIVLFIP